MMIDPSTADFSERRSRMVERDIARRGITSHTVLDAMRRVPRERFIPHALAEFAYDDTPLPIDEGQTISQPYIVATMVDAAEIGPDDRVLEIGTGSGYGAAVIGCVAGEVWTIERHEPLAMQARRRLAEVGALNVHAVCGDGTLGWPEAAPFDAIIVTAGGPMVPKSLVEQLGDGGRLVIPVGSESRSQQLVRVRRDGDEFLEEDLGAVRFVPLIGEEGWEPPLKESLAVPVVDDPARSVATATRHSSPGAALLVREEAQPFDSIQDAELGPLLDRIGDSRIVMLGEASHGTSEFYRMRGRITRELIEHKGFTAVAVEADWPDAAQVDAYVRHRPSSPPPFEPFTRFPTWLWRNREVRGFVEWLREHNARTEDPRSLVSFHGLDLYSMYTSRDAVLSYLEGVDPDAAAVARRRYGCLTPWEQDPARYGHAVMTGRISGCEDGVVATLTDLLRQRMEYAAADGDRFIEAAQNASVVANAERYYRVMYHGSRQSWNLRDLHMFETLQVVRSHRGPDAKVVVWEHNSHIGDASATEMGARGEHNIGMLARREYGRDAFLVGFGTDHGTVAAASDWGGPMEVKQVRPSHPESYERLFHESGIPAFLLHLRDPGRPDLREELGRPRLERAIGVIYRPETELQSHYFQASLPHQFDEYVWFDATQAVTPVPRILPPGEG
jgi:protein-L-isoaspartate(D-aspartate) O-methyltransferase